MLGPDGDRLVQVEVHAGRRLEDHAPTPDGSGGCRCGRRGSRGRAGSARRNGLRRTDGIGSPRGSSTGGVVGRVGRSARWRSRRLHGPARSRRDRSPGHSVCRPRRSAAARCPRAERCDPPCPRSGRWSGSQPRAESTSSLRTSASRPARSASVAAARRPSASRSRSPSSPTTLALATDTHPPNQAWIHMLDDYCRKKWRTPPLAVRIARRPTSRAAAGGPSRCRRGRRRRRSGPTGAHRPR
jgi:hypothetical protein